jgi:hypothetical protein
MDTYLDYMDLKRKLPTQGIFSRSGATPTKHIRSEENIISPRTPVPRLSTELYDPE